MIILSFGNIYRELIGSIKSSDYLNIIKIIENIHINKLVKAIGININYLNELGISFFKTSESIFLSLFTFATIGYKNGLLHSFLGKTLNAMQILLTLLLAIIMLTSFTEKDKSD